MRGTRVRLTGILVIAAAAVLQPACASLAAASTTAGPRQSEPPSTIGTLPGVLVGNKPNAAAFDPATRTVYVANMLGNTLSLVNAATCNARNTAGCGQTPATVATGNAPFDVAIDDATHTVYVTNSGDNTVSVINAATCNATVTTGCGQKPATVTVDLTPFGLAVDAATDTIYVADIGGPGGGLGDTVSVINGKTCNAINTTGCGQTPATVTVGNAPFSVAVDGANQTVYVTNGADNTVSMINARTCRAGATSGCMHTPATVAVGTTPTAVAVNPGTGTLYVGNNVDATVSVINATTCNATVTTGCHGGPVLLHTPGAPAGLAVNERTDTLFASNQAASFTPGPDNPARGNTVSVINAATCNATVTTGCGQRAPLALTGGNPAAAAVDPATGTAYVATDDNAVTVINPATCHGAARTGCGQPVPGIITGSDPFSAAINPATHTAYIGNAGAFDGLPSSVAVLNTATCNAATSTGCRRTLPAIPMQFAAIGVAVNPATDTLYATNTFDSNGNPGTAVSVINGATCNATVTTGCSDTPATVTVGRGPAGVAVNQATDTIYVANQNSNTVSVINGKACNGTTTSGCGQKPATVPLGASPVAAAVDQATDTIYVLNAGSPGTVSVINGKTCNATVTTGCKHTPPTVTVGNGTGFFAGLAVNPVTDTIYAVNTADGTVSVINGKTCNATVTTGCKHTPATVRAGRMFAGFAAADPATNLIYVSDSLDDTVSAINGNTCNGTRTSGCTQAPPTVPAGGNPAGLAVDPASHTIYAADSANGPVSFFRFQPPGRPAHVTATTAHGQVKLAWHVPPDGRLPVIYHVIPAPACPACRGLATPSTSGIPATTITGLTPGTTYTFKVKATDAAGTGRASAASNPVRP